MKQNKLTSTQNLQSAHRAALSEYSGNEMREEQTDNLWVAPQMGGWRFGGGGVLSVQCAELNYFGVSVQKLVMRWFMSLMLLEEVQLLSN